MASSESEFLKIKRCVLKVNMHCLGCVQKVRKLLRKIDGVYTVNIDAEKQQVMVMGSVDSASLINKLARSGKHAELWMASPNLPQTKMNANHIENLQAQYQHNGHNNEPSSAQNVRPESFHNEDDSGWDTKLFLSQNMGTEAEAGKFKQDFVLATEMENIYGGGNGADFVGLGSHEFGVSQGYIAEPLVSI